MYFIFTVGIIFTTTMGLRVKTDANISVQLHRFNTTSLSLQQQAENISNNLKEEKLWELPLFPGSFEPPSHATTLVVRQWAKLSAK